MIKLITTTAAALMMLAGPAFAGGGGHMGNGGSSSSANSYSQSGASNSNRNIEKHQAPGFGLAGLAATGACPEGSWTAAISTPWGGLGGGKTINEEKCIDLFMMGQAKMPLKVIRTYVQRQSPRIADAVKNSQ